MPGKVEPGLEFDPARDVVAPARHQFAVRMSVQALVNACCDVQTLPFYREQFTRFIEGYVIQGNEQHKDAVRRRGLAFMSSWWTVRVQSYRGSGQTTAAIQTATDRFGIENVRYVAHLADAAKRVKKEYPGLFTIAKRTPWGNYKGLSGCRCVILDGTSMLDENVDLHWISWTVFTWLFEKTVQGPVCFLIVA